MNGYRKIIHSLLGLGGILAVTVGVLMGPHEPAGAAVNLVRFEVAFAPDNSGIVVMWESASEFQTQAYHVYRAVASKDLEDAVEVGQEFASNTSGASYEWIDVGRDLDSGLELGREYFYWLYEVTQSGNFMLLSVGDEAYRSVVFGATSTPTATSTSTAPATSTATPRESSGPGTTGSSPTSTRQPTAPERATNTPTFTPVVPSNTPAVTRVPPTSTPMVLTNTPTPQLLSTPVADLAATSDPGIQPEVVPAALAQNATVTAQPQQVAQVGTRQAGEAEVTREARPTATPRLTEAAGSAGQVSTLLLVVGGGSLCGAGMLILVALFVWRRR